MAFPLMAPVNTQGTHYRGFITVNGQDHFVDIDMPTRDVTSATVSVSPGIKHHLRGYEDLIQKRLGQCDHDLALFLRDFCDILERALAPTLPTRSNPMSSERLSMLVSQLDQIGFDSIESINDDMTDLSFLLRDRAQRLHSIRVFIPPTYPFDGPRILMMDLPVPIKDTDLDSIHHPTLHALLEQVSSVLDQFHDFFDTMDEIDEKARVLDPEKPRRGDTWRRVALGNHCSMHLSIRPAFTRDIPRVKFFGSASRTAHFNDTWHKKASQSWDAKLSLYANLVAILSIPSRTRLQESNDDTVMETDDMECGICYAYKLGVATTSQQTPDVICPNEQCSRGFHPSCLYEACRV